MRKVILQLLHDDYDSLGVLCSGVKKDDFFSASSSALMVAHDITEHQNGLKAIGTICDELEALGGVWYVRGQHGPLHQKYIQHHSPQEGIASDIEYLFELFYTSNVPIRDHVQRRHESPAHEEFTYIIDIAKKSCFTEYSDDNSPEKEKAWETFSFEALWLMNRGYLKAMRRYPDPLDGYETFWAIYNTIEDLLRDDYLYSADEAYLLVSARDARYKLVFGEEELEDY